MDHHPDHLLHNLWARRLREWWQHYNWSLLADALKEPAFCIDVASGRLGRWDGSTRTLGISASHLRRDPWPEVMETLRHEMAHQYVDELHAGAGEGPHGEVFRAACERLRTDPRAARTAGHRPRTADEDRVVVRIEKLLSLGTSPNENEAQAAVTKARELLLRHNLDPARLGTDRGFEVRWLGPLKKRHAPWEQVLAGILSEFFFVAVIWVHSYDPLRDYEGTVLEACGTPANLDMAAYVHGFLSAVAEPLWREWRRTARRARPQDRMRYYAGVMQGFRDRLRDEDRALRDAHALVWKGDPALEAFQCWRHPRVRTGRSRCDWRSEAQDEGRRAGRNVTLRRPLGSETGGLGGLLSG